jgi:hypothetical protein
MMESPPTKIMTVAQRTRPAAVSRPAAQGGAAGTDCSKRHAFKDKANTEGRREMIPIVSDFAFDRRTVTHTAFSLH